MNVLLSLKMQLSAQVFTFHLTVFARDVRACALVTWPLVRLGIIAELGSSAHHQKTSMYLKNCQPTGMPCSSIGPAENEFRQTIESGEYSEM